MKVYKKVNLCDIKHKTTIYWWQYKIFYNFLYVKWLVLFFDPYLKSIVRKIIYTFLPDRYKCRESEPLSREIYG
jgi:hypothetical protein